MILCAACAHVGAPREATPLFAWVQQMGGPAKAVRLAVYSNGRVIFTPRRGRELREALLPADSLDHFREKVVQPVLAHASSPTLLGADHFPDSEEGTTLIAVSEGRRSIVRAEFSALEFGEADPETTASLPSWFVAVLTEARSAVFERAVAEREYVPPRFKLFESTFDFIPRNGSCGWPDALPRPGPWPETLVLDDSRAWQWLVHSDCIVVHRGVSWSFSAEPILPGLERVDSL